MATTFNNAQFERLPCVVHLTKALITFKGGISMSEQYEGPLSLLMSKHESMKTVHSQMAIDFAKEIADGNVSEERQAYMHKTLLSMENRMKQQAKFFERFNMPMTKEELHSFTGGYNDEAWTVGHRKFGRYSS